jgi:predicted esterase
MFTSFGADTEMYWHRGGHELGQDDIDAAQQWLSRKSAVWQNSKQAASGRG